MENGIQASSNHLIPKQKIQEFENQLLTLPQVEIETKHYVANGVYVREIVIPKGVVVTGAVHLTETIDILVSGDITIVYDDTKKRLTGHGIYISKPGVKKVAYAHADTVWITAHPIKSVPDDKDKEESLEDIEKSLWVNSYDEYTALIKNKGEHTWLLS